MENQLTILAESLEEKRKVLIEIQEYNKQQETALTGEQFALEDFDTAVDEKGKLIDRLNRLDEGFELLYRELSEQLQCGREKYAEQIRGIQRQIEQISELSIAIQVQEKRNKELVEQFFTKQRTTLRQNRKASKVAYDYYKKMNSPAYTTSSSYDVRN